MSLAAICASDSVRYPITSIDTAHLILSACCSPLYIVKRQCKWRSIIGCLSLTSHQHVLAATVYPDPLPRSAGSSASRPAPKYHSPQGPAPSSAASAPVASPSAAPDCPEMPACRSPHTDGPI